MIKKMKDKKDYVKCCICDYIICKYKMDINNADCVLITVPDLITGIGCSDKIICDSCAKKIAMELIER
jgi:hypothetical protein